MNGQRYKANGNAVVVVSRLKGLGRILNVYKWIATHQLRNPLTGGSCSAPIVLAACVYVLLQPQDRTDQPL